MKESVRKTARNLGIILLISVGCTFYFAGFNSNLIDVAMNILYGVIIGLTIALGSGMITRSIFKRESVYDNPIRYYLIAIISVTVYIFVSIVLVNFLWFYFTQGVSFSQLFTHPFAIYALGSELILGELIYLIALSRYFARDLQKYYKRLAEVESQLSQYRYDTLKNQLNPHLLFNALNTLSGLIYIDAEKADAFTHRLSKLYRYILDVQKQEVVPIEMEMDLLSDFIYLNNIRFNDQIKVSTELDSAGGYVAPMALQLLLENAIKHNRISEKEPLQITIKSTPTQVIIENNLQPKIEKEPSHELGLKNLRERYASLTDTPIDVKETDSNFIVVIPLLQKDEA